MLDLVVRNARVYDGSGAPAFLGDVGMIAGRVAQVGHVQAQGATEVDARGLVLAPGFIDVHTHYDAQLCWDGLAQPALEHGVTTVVTGNCSLTLAPLRAEQRDRLCRMFRRIEDMPAAAFDDGIDWRWETFEEYLAALRGTIGINIAPLVGHSLIRMWVIGEEAFSRTADAREVSQMRELLRECLYAGASGMSTSYIDVDENYLPVPSRMASHEELRALASVIGEVGHGMLQIVPEYYDTAMMVHRVDMLAELSLEYGIRTTLSPVFESAQAPELAGAVIARVQQHVQRGAQVWPQVQTRPVDINFRLRERNFMLMAMPGWFQVLNQEGKEPKRAAYTDPVTRARLVSELQPEGEHAQLTYMSNRVNNTVIRGTKLERNRHMIGRRLGDLAAERGVRAAEFMIDIALEEDLDTEFKTEGLSHTDAEVVGEMLANRLTLIGASDAGAHVQAFATNGDTGYLFSKFVRETGALDLAGAIRKTTFDAATAWGLRDRGLIREGYAADLVLFDPDAIDRGEEIGVEDLPGAGFRYIRRARGIEMVIVNGQLTYTASGGYSAARVGDVVSLGSPRAV